MILSKVYEDAENRLERNEITLGEFERLVDIEVIEPKRGEWIDDDFVGQYRCSECDYYAIDEYDYCPNCGAHMRGEDDEYDK